MLGEMDIIIVHSEAAKAAMKLYSGSEKFVQPIVIPHGMMPPRSVVPRAEAEKALGLNSEKKRFTLLSVGFISINKRHPLLINMVPSIISALKSASIASQIPHREFNLIIAGSDPIVRGACKSALFNSIEFTIAQMKLRNQIRIFDEFVPFERLPVFYGAADACVHMCGGSQHSSSGSVRMDLTHGMPVFVQRAELTQDLPANVVGFFDQDRDLIPLLKNAYTDNSILERMSIGATEMSRRHSWSEVAIMHVGAYFGLGVSDLRSPEPEAPSPSTDSVVTVSAKEGGTVMGSPRVAFVSRWGVQCGIATYTGQLVNALCRQGAGIICIAEEPSGLAEIPATPDIEVVRCWRGKAMDVDAMYDNIRVRRVDVVHFQHEFGIMNDARRMLQLVDAVHRGNVSIAITCHTVMPKPHNETSWFFRDFLNQVDAIVVHTQDAKNAMVDWGHTPGKVHVISHGTPEGCAVDDKARSRDILYIPNKKDLVVAVSLGFITPGKMQKETIREVIWLVREGLLDPSKFLYVVAGEPGQNNPINIMYCREIHKIVDDNRAWNYVRIVPRFIPMDELPVWYGAADFAITASHQTFFSTSGRSHQEMAYGIPSISSNARLLSDLDETRSLKFDFDEEEAYQFRFNVLAMIRDPKLRARLTVNCLKFADETSWTKISNQHIELYKTLISRKG